MYTFGTHVSFDSPDEKYGGGTLPELNKFYNLNHQFKLFMEKFKNSPAFENTILVFTTDHATYADDAYNDAFPLVPRATTSFDEIPLFIYHKGITPETIEVNEFREMQQAYFITKEKFAKN